MAQSTATTLSPELEAALQELMALRSALGVELVAPVPGATESLGSALVASAHSWKKKTAVRDAIPLPVGWKQTVDRKTGALYYVNRASKERQSKRPELSLNKTAPDLTKNPDSEEGLQEVNRFSKRLNKNELGSLKELLKSGDKSTSQAQTNLTNQSSSLNINSPLLVGNTVSQMESLGRIDKVGYLNKRSKLMGRWIKRYFVLSGNNFSYYDDENLSNMKSCKITGDTGQTYTLSDNSFSVKGLLQSDGSVAEDWNLMADSESAMEDWVAAIGSHIHLQFKSEQNVKSDFWEHGEINTSFWKVPYSTPEIQRLPVGIRTLPYMKGPRTNEGVFPGETVEIVQTIKTRENTFLRLADDRGWIFEMHPKDAYALFERAEGECVKGKVTYKYQSLGNEGLPLYPGPCAVGEPVTSLPQGSIFTINTTWSPQDSDEYDFPVKFVKLSEERVWACVNNLESGDVHLHRVN